MASVAKLPAKTYSSKKKEPYREFLETMGLETFVLFYEDFETGTRDKTIRLLRQKGYTQNSAQVRWNAGRNIFKSSSQVLALEYISISSKIPDTVRKKAQALLLKEKMALQ